MEGIYFNRERFPFYLVLSLLLQGRGSTFTIDCSRFEQHGVDPSALDMVFDRKAFRPATNLSVPTQVNISFTLSAIRNVVWDNPFISWNPKKCKGITNISVATKNLWLPDIFIVESIDVDETPQGLIAYVSNDGRIRYKKPMKVASICSLDIFYFPFDQQNCTLTFRSFIYTVDNMLLGMEKEVWEIEDTSRDIVQTHGEWEFLGINKATPKMLVGDNLYDEIMFYVAMRRRPTLYIINLLVPSSFLVAIDAVSFYLPAESGNRAPFKITLLLGYNVFLLLMNDLLPTSGAPLITVYFALCLSLMVLSLLETVFIAYLLHLATNQPPPMPRWLHSLLLHCTCPRKYCPTVSHKGNEGLGLPPAQLPGVKEPVELVEKSPGPGEAEPAGGSGWTRAQREQEAQKRHRVELWVQFSHMMDTLLFRLYLLFMAFSILTVIGLWNT
ncbi:PREDICTED: 5-hydroxytryptamine receptor 3E-like isoform X2 [Propithecus coquereli]|uniref:5-hydroxytryptamine receptor 3E n=1 Tax=Propithecus coquereli TaxID=379532 RepID=A0A2K6GES2_PROCO|nr:PREDICTED: 5-hydroxytryptamine receptor 3E-like isoform X2 [Propithecus coquereli]